MPTLNTSSYRDAILRFFITLSNIISLVDRVHIITSAANTITTQKIFSQHKTNVLITRQTTVQNVREENYG